MITIIAKDIVNADSEELKKENAKLELCIKRNETIIADLKMRLQTSLQADEITKKQELITLKKNIGSALKLRYDKFTENQDAIYSEDNYEVLRASIHQIFRVLKRYGIEL